MSSIEPPTTAKVVLNTTKGPIEIELWAAQTPLACRNFIQLCVNGYYDNCIFHRVVKDFIIQAGDPSGTGYGGTPIYPEGSFKDEFHSRLRFNRRGLVGCANTGKRDSNGSQFIITLAATPELNGKNTLFGRIVGDTIFNVLRIGESELCEDDRPLYPTVITGAQLVVPYFEDIHVKKKEEPLQVANRELDKKRKKPTVRVVHDDEEEEEGLPRKTFKMKPAKGIQEKQIEEIVSKQESVKGTPQMGSESSKKQGAVETKSGPAAINTRPKPAKRRSDREKQTLELLVKFQSKLLDRPQPIEFTQPSTTTLSLYPKDYDSDNYDETLDDNDKDKDFLTHRFEYRDSSTQGEDSFMTVDSNKAE